jgi:phytoene synthase
LRPAFDALLDIDAAMADVVAKATEPTLAAKKHAWWRERLEELDQGKAPAEPRLQAAARELLPLGISGRDLASLEAGNAALLQQQADAEAVLERGTQLFTLGARILRTQASPLLEMAGHLYAAGQVRRLGLAPTGTCVVTDLFGIPVALRPLTALAVLAKRDLRRCEPEATPGRAFALLRHRLTGRI